MSKLRQKLTSVRHKVVKRLVVLSLGVTSIFGVNSFFFSFSQNSLDGAISHIEALEALKTSSATDQISTISKLNKNSFQCSNNYPKECEGYFEALIQVRNRMLDYKITFAETLGLKTDHKINSQLSRVLNQAGIVASDAFKISFEDAKRRKIATAAEYISALNFDSLQVNNFLTTNKRLNAEINILYSQISEWIDSQYQEGKPLPTLVNELNIAYLILVFAEICLFLLVCIIDFLNNNAYPQSQAAQLDS